VSDHVGFFLAHGVTGRPRVTEAIAMLKTNSTMAQQIAEAAIRFEGNHNGIVPESATVVLSGDTLVITLHGALSPAEKALAQTPAGAAQIQEFHRQLFTSSSESLREEIKRITGVEVREATAEVEPTTGTVVHVFTSGTMVQVFLLAGNLPAETWTGRGAVDQP
jgi:uncharacterized protein YbcI